MDSPKIIYPNIRASDSRSWLSCKRRVWLEHTDLELEVSDDAFLDLIKESGILHESNVLEELKSTHEVHWSKSAEDTQVLMAQEVDVIYQGQLSDPQTNIVGNPDFLIHMGDGQYQAADAKLSNNEVKGENLIQIGVYQKLLDNGLPGLVYRGDGAAVEINTDDHKNADEFVFSMQKLLANSSEPDVKYAYSKCSTCPYSNHCTPAFEARQDTSLVYGIRGDVSVALANNGIKTITDLASAEAKQIPDIPYLKGDAKKQSAILQAKAHLDGKIYQINDINLPKGTWVHFDIEDNPLAYTLEKHVYLWGFLVPGYSDQNFEYVWTDDESQDYQGWLSFLSLIDQYRERYSDLILAHYSHHEVATIRKYAERYSMENNETVECLLGDNSPLFDIQKPILDNLTLPVRGYGLKQICKHKELVNFHWSQDESGSQWSIVQFVRYIQEKDLKTKQKLKSEILGYNRDDVKATRAVENWLRNLKSRAVKENYI